MSAEDRVPAPAGTSAPTPAPAPELISAGKRAAEMCREIVRRSSVEIQGRRYVRVEGWQSIALAHGCVASARAVERVKGGVRAIGEVRRADTGAVLATAEGFVGDDEPTWAKRPEYARRAMAQTRAISRACRSAFAHVVVLMSTEHERYETTPAEEVPEEGFPDRQRPRAAGPRRPPAKPAQRPPAPANGGRRARLIARLRELSDEVGEPLPPEDVLARATEEELVDLGHQLRALADRRVAAASPEPAQQPDDPPF